MPVKENVQESYGVFFITFTCFNWLPLIEHSNSYASVYNWFNHLKKMGHRIIGYVIMPNHIHTIISFKDTRQPINTIIGNGKRFMAYEIINKLRAKSEVSLLKKMSLAVSSNEKVNGKKYRVWEYSFDWKECDGDKFIEQKLNYIHENPCKGKWNLVNFPEEYQHSSARFYLHGEQGVYPVIHYFDLKDID